MGMVKIQPSEIPKPITIRHDTAYYVHMRRTYKLKFVESVREGASGEYVKYDTIFCIY